ncbi:MAG: SNF2-related protein [Candidatus Moranbacteria bacterium GW2011_GWF2_36_839]|nr:MAG: SNF2-related protein [Candidatus Moranbacteria bacterium GW2011_GWF1_36_78]KKQ17260.1 MAG: SNF2-related protein [Candidatus Moranbacteria bacterium GW2011_GWF2_36_839]HAT73897.1 hypothetical protein [Candidatus Moranbacteria bacterium]HBY10960.1 hypothetical protein [Candidatus Moranbacteria bacterium]
MIKITFDRNNLIDQLKSIHGDTIFGRGKVYFEQGLVGKLKILDHRSKEKIKIEANVNGTDIYATSIVFNFLTNKFSTPNCTCPYDWGECKHSVALGLKFIDLWEETYEMEDEFLNFEEIKKLLISFAKISKNNNENDLVYDYTDVKPENYQEAEIIDIVDKNDIVDHFEKSQEKKEAQLKKLLQMIGIDANGLSQQVLEELGDKLISKSEKKNELKKENLPKDISKKYHLILDVNYNARIDIAKNNNDRFFYWQNQPKNILQEEKKNLTLAQKELLEILCSENFFETREIDWEKIFQLIKLSGFSISLNHRSIKTELYFPENSERITAEIFFKETENYHNHSEFSTQTDFVFRLDGEFWQKDKSYYFCGNEHLILIRNNQIEIHPISPILARIVARILENGHRYYEYYHNYQFESQEKYFWETEFRDEEIIKINEILEGARKYFVLKTSLAQNFSVKKFKKIGPAISVEYDSQNNNLRVRAIVDYGFSKIDVGQTVTKSMKGGTLSFQKNELKNRGKYHIKINEQEICYADICRKEEQHLFSKFYYDEKYGFSKNLKCVRENAKKIMHYHKNHWPHIKSLNYPIEFTRDEFNFYEENFKADFSVDMNAENDWLAFDVDCYLGKDRISLEDLKNYLKNKEEFIRMNDGRMLRISNWEELERFILMLESFYQKASGSFEGRAYHAPELENIFANSEYYSAQVAEGFKKFISEAQSGRSVEKIKLPSKINRTLRDYQKEGIHWFHFLRKYRFAGILADDMGLGKTLQALTLLEMNKNKDKPSIVICPKTLLFNWEQEAVKFFPYLKVLIIEGQPKERAKNIGKIKNYDLIITSYSTIKKDGDIYEKKQIKFNYCFLDEAQFIKNHKTQNARAVKKIDADYKLALTGTPLENSVSEIWSVFDFLMPGFLGNYNHFTKRFLTPIMKKNDAKALQCLRKKVECFMLRRTKSEVLKELPPKVEQVVISELTEAQNILYQEILANVKSEIMKTVSEKGFQKSQIHILAGLMKLRQVCNHPTLLLKNKDYAKYESAKLESFQELIEEIVSSGRKVLVFSQFTQMLDILAKVLEKDKIKYLYLSGKTKNRKEMVEEFNASENKRVFLISLKAGGTGLNLTSADNVIIFDPWWNPSVENQAIDRTHRIGQKKSVNVYRLITKGTIEEKIVKLQEKKKFLFDNLVGESKDLFKKLTWEDVKELFG